MKVIESETKKSELRLPDKKERKDGRINTIVEYVAYCTMIPSFEFF